MEGRIGRFGNLSFDNLNKENTASRNKGLTDFSFILGQEINWLRKNIDALSIINSSEKGFRKIVTGVVNKAASLYLPKKEMAEVYESEIATRKEVMAAIGRGEDRMPTEYLIGRIEGAISAAIGEKFFSNNKKNDWTREARRNIKILDKIDPQQASALRNRLQKEGLY